MKKLLLECLTTIFISYFVIAIDIAPALLAFYISPWFLLLYIIILPVSQIFYWFYYNDD